MYIFVSSRHVFTISDAADAIWTQLILVAYTYNLDEYVYLNSIPQIK